MASELDLADWRRRTGELYAAVRDLSKSDPSAAWALWIARRGEMMRSHPSSPFGEEERSHPPRYYRYDAAWRIVGTPVALDPQGEELRVLLPEGELGYRPVFQVAFEPPVAAGSAALTLYWLSGYGGGLFLPFGDTTNGASTYGGGRYLYDTIKGADLGASTTEIVLDFNFAYNPSCTYSPRWICPLTRSENRLPFPVEAGEMAPATKVPAERSR